MNTFGTNRNNNMTVTPYNKEMELNKNDKYYELKIRRARKSEDINSLLKGRKEPLVKMKTKKYYQDNQKQKFEFKKIIGFHDIFQKESKNFYSNEYLKMLSKLLRKKDSKYYLKRKQLESMITNNSGNIGNYIKTDEKKDLYLTGTDFNIKLESKLDEHGNNKNSNKINDIMVSHLAQLELLDGDDISNFSFDSKVENNCIKEQIYTKLEKQFKFYHPKNKSNDFTHSLFKPHLPIKSVSANVSLKNSFTEEINGKSKNYLPNINQQNTKNLKNRHKIINSKNYSISKIPRPQLPKNKSTINIINNKLEFKNKLIKIEKERLIKLQKLVKDFKFEEGGTGV